jgi:hypothetical protein
MLREISERIFTGGDLIAMYVPWIQPTDAHSAREPKAIIAIFDERGNCPYREHLAGKSILRIKYFDRHGVTFRAHGFCEVARGDGDSASKTDMNRVDLPKLQAVLLAA